MAERPVVAPAHVEVTQVPDSEQFLAGMARKKLLAANPCVIAITGSVGKTSTRNAIATVLRGRFDVLSTTGNLNTVLGISLTLLNGKFDRETKVVLEMGACRPGDIAGLCGYFPPKVAVVTNVCGVHLETFGTIEGVARTKSEIVRALGADGTACLNGDDPRVRAMESLNAGQTVRYGTGAHCDVVPGLITQDIPLLGDHVIYLVLAAFAAGYTQGMPRDEINERLAMMRPEKGRLSRLEGICGCTLIDDSYNASPVAMRTALGVLQRQPADRRIAYLGDMLELGEASLAEHKKVLRDAVGVADIIVVVGKHMAAARASLPDADQRAIVVFASSTEAADALRAGDPVSPGEGDAVLVKGSQGMRMEHVSRVLLHDSIAPESVLCRQTESWRQI